MSTPFVTPTTLAECGACCEVVFDNQVDIDTCFDLGCANELAETFPDCEDITGNNAVTRAVCETGRSFRLVGAGNSGGNNLACDAGVVIFLGNEAEVIDDPVTAEADCLLCCDQLEDLDEEFNILRVASCEDKCIASELRLCASENDARRALGCGLGSDIAAFGSTTFFFDGAFRDFTCVNGLLVEDVDDDPEVEDDDEDEDVDGIELDDIIIIAGAASGGVALVGLIGFFLFRKSPKKKKDSGKGILPPPYFVDSGKLSSHNGKGSNSKELKMKSKGNIPGTLMRIAKGPFNRSSPLDAIQVNTPYQPSPASRVALSGVVPDLQPSPRYQDRSQVQSFDVSRVAVEPFDRNRFSLETFMPREERISNKRRY